MSFQLRPHPAEVAVEASGETIEDTVAAVADGMAAAMCSAIPNNLGERFEVESTGEDKEAMLFEYLSSLIVARDVRAVLPVDNEVSLNRTDHGWYVSGTARGVPLTAVDARDLKAVTYSDMRLEATATGWEAYVVFDV